MQIRTKATTMWLETLSREFIISSKEHIKQDPETFWPDEEGEKISRDWASYPGNPEICFEGDGEEVYACTEDLPKIEILVTERGTEFTVPAALDEPLKSQIMAACKLWIERAQSDVTAIAAEFSNGLGMAEIRTLDLDIALSLDVEAEEPVNPAKDCILVLMSVSFREVCFQHMLGVVFRGIFYTWEVIEGDGGSGFTTDYYDANGRRYMSFLTCGQFSDIKVY